MLALTIGSAAFQAPAATALSARRLGAPGMANIADLPGAGIEVGGKVFDPLGLADLCPYGSEQFEWMRTAEVRRWAGAGVLKRGAVRGVGACGVAHCRRARAAPCMKLLPAIALL